MFEDNFEIRRDFTLQKPNILQPIVNEGMLPQFLTNLGFILANDHCRRNCLHCPAYGDTAPLQNIPFNKLTSLVSEIGQAYKDHRQPITRSIASWRISDPLDYHVRDGEVRRSTYDVAQIWQEHLDQGLYIVTNGSEGRTLAKKALARMNSNPEIVSQLKLTVTPFDANWGTERYFQDIVSDIDQLKGLWQLPSTRIEDPLGLKFRINVKTTPSTQTEASDFIKGVLAAVGINGSEYEEAISDPRKLAFKEIYDLGSFMGNSPIPDALDIRVINGERYKPTENERTRFQFAIHPDGFIRIVDMYAFKVSGVLKSNSEPLRLSF